MHVIHGTWLPDKNLFAMWGEDTGIKPQYRKGRRGKTAPHSFPLAMSHLLRYLDRFSTDASPEGGAFTFWLPGFGKQVQPSSEAMSAGMEGLDSPLELLAWDIECMLLNVSDMLDCMLQLPNDLRGVAYGADFVFWKQAALLVMNGLVEGRFLPVIDNLGTQYRAWWQARPDADLLAQMVENMPPVCRARVDELDAVMAPAELLQHFLDIATDTFVRECYAGERLPKHPWLRALTGDDPIMRGPERELMRLHRTWEQWAALDAGGGAFRVCFRLSEPSEDDEFWPLGYLLQATDDPSLLVEAETVWTQGYLGQRFHHPEEKLLAALGLASRVFPPIERSLRTNQPVGVQLDRDEAFAFLVDALPLLEANGFAVLVPNWWGRRAKIKARARLRGKTPEPTGILTSDTLLNYQWEMSLGGERISRAEFEELVALKQPLVRYRGQWVALDPDQIEAALKFFEQTAAGEMDVMDALKMQATGDAPELDGIEIEGMEVEGWLDDMFQQIQEPERAEVPPLPQTLKADLRPYQERGYGWLVQMRQMKMGACLADDMGLGKTLQTITFWLYEREQLDVKQPALLVCPTSVVGNWGHEIARFAPRLKVMKHQGADRLKDADAFARAVGDVDVVLTSYALLSRDLDILQTVEWSSMTLDEAQNIKNPSTKQAQVARTIQADHKLALTGTPVENRLSELWSIFQYLNPGYLGSHRAFKSTFATPIERYGDDEAAQQLKKLTSPFILRRLKTDPKVIQDLPEKFENKVYCDLTAEQATLYEAAVREEMEAIEGAEEDMARRGNILRMLTRLKQICNHPAQFLKEGAGTTLVDRSGKLNRLVEMIEEIREVDERALIFTQYAEMGHLLQPFLREYFVDEVLFLHGGTPPKKREDMVRIFQSAGGPPVFLLSVKAGGTGLNLTAANHVFHFDRWYNPAVENQATDRAFRIGQQKNVQVHKFICLGTLEERIDELIEHKQALADQIVGSGENWLSELSDADLRDLVTLRQEAVR